MPLANQFREGNRMHPVTRVIQAPRAEFFHSRCGIIWRKILRPARMKAPQFDPRHLESKHEVRRGRFSARLLFRLLGKKEGRDFHPALKG
jgi:hypothetical protein